MYDVVVVGAGPAGCVAAHDCAKAGLKTLLIEKHRLPRDKLCGGGITSKVTARLGSPLPDRIIERRLRTARIHLRSSEYDVSGESPFVMMTSRTAFDEHLAERAVDAGSDLIDTAPVKRVQKFPDGIEVKADGQNVRTKLVIGCDGANSQVARDVGLRQTWDRHQVALGVESEVYLDPSEIDSWIGTSEAFDLYFGCSPAGYGWIFPKRDRLTVGVGCRLDRLTNSRELFASFLKLLRLPADAKLSRPLAHLIPVGGLASVRSYADHVMLAGDAAAFVEPLLGEGIYFAIWGGQLAAQTAVEAHRVGRFDAEFLSRYERRWRKAFWDDFKIAYAVAKFTYLEDYHMEAALRFLFQRPEVKRCMLGLMSGEVSHRDVRNQLFWVYLLHKLSTKLGLARSQPSLGA